LAQQAERQRRQGEQKLESMRRQLADADDDDRRVKLESQIAELEKMRVDQQDESEARLAKMKQGLASLDDVDFDACQESLAALKDASALDEREMQRAVAAGLAAQRQSVEALKGLGYLDADDDDGGGDGGKKKVDARKIRAAVERALAQSREATERACAH